MRFSPRPIHAAIAWLGVLGLTSSPALALDVTAVSGSPADIQAAVDQVHDAGGGAVFIPEGEFVFDGDVKMSDGIDLVGAGQDRTVLRGPGTIKVNTRFYGKLDKPFRITGISVLDADKSAIHIDTVSDFRVDHCTVGVSGGAAIGVAKSVRGLIDNCTVLVDGNYYGVTVSGSDVWEDNIDNLLGSGDAIFIEDCDFSGQGHSVVGHGAAHYVFRHNLIRPADAHRIDAHGPGYGPDHGTRCVEVYGNTLEGPGWNGMGIRGGGGVIFNNTIRDFTHGVALVLESGSDTSAYPAPDQVHDMWIWDNTLENVDVPVAVMSLGGVTGGTETAEAFIQQDRDYFLYAKDGYQPYPYPHPMRDGASGGTGGASGAGGAPGSGGTQGDTGGTGGTGTAGGPAGAAGNTNTGTGLAPEDDAEGCACRLHDRPASSSFPLAGLGVLLLLLRRARPRSPATTHPGGLR